MLKIQTFVLNTNHQKQRQKQNKSTGIQKVIFLCFNIVDIGVLFIQLSEHEVHDKYVKKRFCNSEK